MCWNAVLLMAWSLATVTAILDSTKSQRYWEDIKPEAAAVRYQYDDAPNAYALRGGNKHFVTSVFPGNLSIITPHDYCSPNNNNFVAKSKYLYIYIHMFFILRKLKTIMKRFVDTGTTTFCVIRAIYNNVILGQL